MSSALDLPRRVVIVGDTPVAIGVAGILLAAGVTPTLVKPTAFNALLVPNAASGRVERLSNPEWPREVLVYPTLHDAVEVLGDADWILEASGFSSAEKRVLLRHIDGYRKVDSLVTADESVSSVERLTKGFGARFCRDFAVTHFFVPVGRLRLVEVVFHNLMGERRREQVKRIGSAMLGREVLVCRDVPGFVANRIGIFFMAMGLTEAVKQGISVAAADSAVQKSVGTPRSGVFGLIDLIGVDTFARLLTSLRVQLPDTDELQRYGLGGSPVENLIATKRTGKQVGLGFYKYDDRGKPTASLDMGSLQYENLPAERSSDTASTFREIVSAKLHAYMLHVCRSASVSFEEAEMAMALGYGWKAHTQTSN